MAQRTQWPVPCHLCAFPVNRGDQWVIEHKQSRSLRPDLTWEMSNWAISHRSCSNRSGQAAVIEKAKAQALRDAGVSSHVHASTQSPPLPFSPPGGQRKPLEIRPELEWTNATQPSPTWLLPVLAVPQDASVPLAMTPVHPEAVDSYGPDAVVWIETQFGVTLRWWQVLTVIRMLEHRDDGSLCWRTVLLSASRRSGKSLLLRSIACWRLAHAHLFGETQTVVHTGSDVAICREVQRGAWRWAEEVAGYVVSRANGKEAVETPSGDRWLVRSQSAVYGYDACIALGDECWDVPATVVDDGLEPAMLERQSPQLILTSTAHRRATMLMRGRIAGALTQEDDETLLLLWAALPQDDPAAPETWRKASPHWSADRERTLRAKHQAAMAGQADTEFDDPDPMQGFTSQYLNLWRLNERPEPKGDPLASAEQWAGLVAAPEDRKPDAAAIESWFEHGVSLALAWRTDGPAIVQVSDHQDMSSAVEELKASGYRGRVTVGASLKDDPALRGVSMAAGQTRTTAAVADLARLLLEDVLRHDGSEHLAEQVLAVRTQAGADGPRLVSKGRADAIKAATWAVTAARKRQSGSMRMILPSTS